MLLYSVVLIMAMLGANNPTVRRFFERLNPFRKPEDEEEAM